MDSTDFTVEELIACWAEALGEHGELIFTRTTPVTSEDAVLQTGDTMVLGKEWSLKNHVDTALLLINEFYDGTLTQVEPIESDDGVAEPGDTLSIGSGRVFVPMEGALEMLCDFYGGMTPRPADGSIPPPGTPVTFGPSPSMEQEVERALAVLSEHGYVNFTPFT